MSSWILQLPMFTVTSMLDRPPVLFSNALATCSHTHVHARYQRRFCGNLITPIHQPRNCLKFQKASPCFGVTSPECGAKKTRSSGNILNDPSHPSLLLQAYTNHYPETQSKRTLTNQVFLGIICTIFIVLF